MGDNQMDTPTTLDPKRKKVLNLIPPQPNAPNEKVIRALREALKDAKEGKIQAVGIACGCVDESNDSDGGRSTETIISFADGWAHTLAAAVNGMAFRLNYERYTQGDKLPPTELTNDDE